MDLYYLLIWDEDENEHISFTEFPKTLEKKYYRIKKSFEDKQTKSKRDYKGQKK